MSDSFCSSGLERLVFEYFPWRQGKVQFSINEKKINSFLHLMHSNTNVIIREYD